MREDVRTKKDRLNPNRIENRSFSESSLRLRSADKWRMGSVFIAARRYQGNRAAVFNTLRISMHTVVQLWRPVQCQRPEKGCENRSRDKSTATIV